jgi:hypothetical protein
VRYPVGSSVGLSSPSTAIASAGITSHVMDLRIGGTPSQSRSLPYQHFRSMSSSHLNKSSPSNSGPANGLASQSTSIQQPPPQKLSFSPVSTDGLHTT